MSDLKARFAAAVAATETLTERPDNQTLLRLYSLYKQGIEGDVTGKRPGFSDLVARVKYDAWASLQGTAPEAAMQDYIDKVAELQG